MDKNLFAQAADMAKIQAEGYRQVREQARREALEECAFICEESAPDVLAAARIIRALKDKP